MARTGEKRGRVRFANPLSQSLAAIRFLMDYVKRHDFKFFGIYRIVLGAIVLAVAAITALA